MFNANLLPFTAIKDQSKPIRPKSHPHRARALTEVAWIACVCTQYAQAPGMLTKTKALISMMLAVLMTME